MFILQKGTDTLMKFSKIIKKYINYFMCSIDTVDKIINELR